MIPAITDMPPGMGPELNRLAATVAPVHELPGSHGSDADKLAFAEMMRAPDVQTVASLLPASQVQPPSLLEQMARTQNLEINDVFQASRDIMKMAPHMSMTEMAAYGSEVTMNMTIATTQFSLAASFGKSAGKGVDTLMRNQ